MTDMPIKEIHGIADAEKKMMTNSTLQSVAVTDCTGKVKLALSDGPAHLTPDQARKIAEYLIASAARVEAQQ